MFADTRRFVGTLKNPVAYIRNSEIPKYCNQKFWSAYEIWNNTRLTGALPSNKGWADHSKYIIDIVSIMQQEYNTIQREWEVAK